MNAHKKKVRGATHPSTITKPEFEKYEIRKEIQEAGTNDHFFNKFELNT